MKQLMCGALLIKATKDPRYRRSRRGCHSHLSGQTGYHHSLCGNSSITPTTSGVGLRNRCKPGQCRYSLHLLIVILERRTSR